MIQFPRRRSRAASAAPPPGRAARPVLSRARPPCRDGMVELESSSPEETERIARRGRRRAAAPGDVVAVVRASSAPGKTTFVRGACAGARDRRPGHQPDLHDRAPLCGRARRLAPRPLPLRRHVGRGVGRSGALLRRRRRLRRVARGGRGVPAAGARARPVAAPCGGEHRLITPRSHRKSLEIRLSAGADPRV